MADDPRERSTPEPSWWLEDGEALHAEHPRSFFIPPREHREDIRAGEFCSVSFGFPPRKIRGERQSHETIWLEVQSAEPGGAYRGRVDEEPDLTNDLREGDVISFGPEHVTGLVYSPDELGFDPGEWAVIDARIIDQDEAPLALTFAEPNEMDERHWFAALDQQPPRESRWVQLGELTDRWPELTPVFVAGGGMWRRVASTGAYTQV